jgi:small multidrug resistance family-3 protein
MSGMSFSITFLLLLTQRFTPIPILKSLQTPSTILRHTTFRTLELEMSISTIARSILLFLLAGLCEIGGGWLVWQWLREGRQFSWGLIGAFVLILYGIIPTLQPSHFGRVYAAYGGFFIVLSLLWGWMLDGDIPDRFDLVGGSISLLGVLVMMYWPR